MYIVYTRCMATLQAPAAEALDQNSLEGLNGRLDALEKAAKDKLVEQVTSLLALCHAVLCCAVLCHAVWWHAMLCSALL